MPVMYDSRDSKKEYDAFLKKVPYQTAVLDAAKVRYQHGGGMARRLFSFLTA